MRFFGTFCICTLVAFSSANISYADDSMWKPAKNGNDMSSKPSEDDAFVPATNGHNAKETGSDASFAPAQNGFSGASKSGAQKSQNGSILKGRVWNIPEEDKKEEKLGSIEEEKTANNQDKQKKPESEEELTPEQKLWQKYKTLAAAGADKKKKGQKGKTSDKQDDGEKEQASEEMAEAEEQQNKQAEGILKGILQDYKSKQKGAKLNSRSFGSID